MSGLEKTQLIGLAAVALSASVAFVLPPLGEAARPEKGLGGGRLDFLRGAVGDDTRSAA